MKKSFLLFTTLILALSFTACASKPQVPRERDESFIADIDSFVVDSFYLYTAKKNNKVKISEVEIIFVPRTNVIYIDTKVGVNHIRMELSYQERKSILEAHDTYLEQFNSNSIKNEKPTKKNAYSTGFGKILWGTLGYAHSTTTEYITNAYYLEPGKPYFRISFLQNEELPGNQVYSPITNIYISPSQWEKIYEVCNQDALVHRVDEIMWEVQEF